MDYRRSMLMVHRWHAFWLCPIRDWLIVGRLRWPYVYSWTWFRLASCSSLTQLSLFLSVTRPLSAYLWVLWIICLVCDTNGPGCHRFACFRSLLPLLYRHSWSVRWMSSSCELLWLTLSQHFGPATVFIWFAVDASSLPINHANQTNCFLGCIANTACFESCQTHGTTTLEKGFPD